MSNVKHKSVDLRRKRRNRYIDAIEPFRRQFDCTAAEVHGVINGIISENQRLKRQVGQLETENARLVKELEDREVMNG